MYLHVGFSAAFHIARNRLSGDTSGVFMMAAIFACLIS